MPDNNQTPERCAWSHPDRSECEYPVPLWIKTLIGKLMGASDIKISFGIISLCDGYKSRCPCFKAREEAPK